MVIFGKDWASRRCHIQLFLAALTAIGAAIASEAKGCEPFSKHETTSRPADGSTKWLSEIWAIGRPEGSIYDASPFGLSPDRTKAALILRRARPVTNDYCQRLIVVDLTRPEIPTDIGDAGPPIFTEIDGLRGSAFPTGLFKQTSPVWSPDGKQIAYLRRDDGHVQVAVVRSSDGALEFISRSTSDVDSVQWSSDGRSILIGSKADLATKRAAIETEARSGFRFDDRFIPNSSSRPFPSGPNPVTYYRIDVSDPNGSQTLSNEAVDRQRSKLRDIPAAAALYAVAEQGSSAWISEDTPELYPSEKSLWVAVDGEKKMCDFSACRSGIVGIWWNSTGDELRFLRKEGWGNSGVALYTWPVAGGEPRKAMSTQDVVAGCQSIEDQLLCLREGPLRPRYLELLDPKTGTSRLVFEPNAQLDSALPITVRRLTWRTDLGTPAFGDLVFSERSDGTAKLPLIVVQYDTKGFLRGGTGDEIPIIPLAMRGFAILSVQRPPSFAEGSGRQWPSWQDAEAENTKEWRDRRNTVDSVVMGVRIAISHGMVDAERVAITGLSDGASTAISSLITTDLFSTAVLGTCCSDPGTFGLLGGPAWTNALRRYGYPEPDKDRHSWEEISLAMNAERVRAPILMQLSDDEYQLGLETFSALDRESKAVDMIVFPGERHIKWQPAHRLAIYNRTVSWLSFWLKNETAAEALAQDIRHWTALKKRLEDPG